ncbi:serine hydrolase domain-containing protein [Streptosporangium sp. NPDC004379]|uniref:serine hydrolase domain-containing protein n=1 Tax=Streptosporangium sp. NPDC004379 TaxID=3366189 RepID=UPI0036B2BCBD
MNRLGVMSLAVVLTACSPAPPASSAPAAGPPRSDLALAVQAAADDLVTRGAPGAVVHVHDAGVTREAAAGFADAAAGVPMRPDHRFRIASITKTFTAAVILQLVRERELSLEDTLRKLLPGVVPGADGVTVKQLLSHTSGIPDYLTDPRFSTIITKDGRHTRNWPPRALLGYAGKPSQRGVHHYSNSNFILLGLIIEKTTGRPYGQVVRSRITEPLALRATELTDDLLPHRLARARYGDDQGATRVSSSIFWSAGGLVSTARDVAAFYRALFTRSLPEGNAMTDHGGLGIFPEELPCGIRAWSHSGLIHGYSGVAMSSEDGRRQVVIQLNHSDHGGVVSQARKLMCR